MTKFTFNLIALIALSTTAAFGGEWIIFSDELPPGADLAVHGNSQFVVSNSNPYQGANHLKRDFATWGDWGWITGLMSLNLDLSSIDFDTAYVEFYIDGGTNAIGYLELRLAGAAWDPDFQNTGVTVDDQPGYELVKVMLKDFTGRGGGASPTNLDEFTGGTGMIDRISWGFGAAGDLFVDEVRILDAAGGVTAIASNPGPAPGEADVSRDVTLGWKPGEFANTHNIYIGISLDDVNDASVADPMGVLAGQGQGDSSLDPGRLAFGQSYFWRVDEVNGTPDFTVYMGEIWNFTVEPFSIPITGITATASSQFGDSGPENTINGSGLLDDLHGTSAGDMWISGGIPATVEYAFDRAYRLHELWVWNSNQLIEGFVGFGAKDVVIEHSLDGENWSILEGVGPLAQAPGAAGYAHNITIDLGGAVARHVRMTIDSVQGIAPQASLSEVRFFFIPTVASKPNPETGATAVAPDVTLSWGRDGREAGRHDVYLGTEADNLSLAGSVSESSFDTLALDLQLDQTYSWRVDEVNEAMDPSTWVGDIWSFTTVDAISVDDMEAYADKEFLEIWATWVDGFDDPANGSLAGGASGTPETGIVHDGSQSLPMDYDNRTASFSEATRTFDQTQDWTRSGIQSLVLYLNRGADNAGGGQVYVKINDTKIVYEAATGLPPGWDVWTQWTIDLSAVADAASVRSLTIGVEGAGATGVLYVDSIQLFKNAPAASQPLSWFEAESGTITAPLQILTDDPAASAGQYVAVPNGTGNSSDQPPADGLASYALTIPEDGVYRLAFRVIAPSGGDDSFWVRIPGMVTNTGNHASGWVRFNGIQGGDTWHWDEVHSNDDGNSVVEFTLSAGTQSLEVRYREDGTYLDAIALLK
ncbi:MAG: hypothetical protein IIA65_01035 [Planctomycetes bacterium]|nr:hypothetical protein [Planctomycetota bacterium]